MAEKPNIVLINCDDLGYGDLGCYGSPINRTPALDRLADQGTRFTDFYAASPVCSPSRGALMTGCYPERIGFGAFEGSWVLFPGQGLGLSTDERTLASMLREAGYATSMVGKWHCGDQREFLPTRHGFDEYYGIPYSNDMGRQQGRTHFPPLPLIRDEAVIQQQPDQRNIIERYTEQSTRFIRANQDRPFFLYLAHLQVHRPLYSPQRFMDTAPNGRYGAAVEAIDWSASVIMHELERLGLDQNTLVIFTSDNGSRADMGGSNDPLRGTKGTTWEGGMRVPCLMRWPGRIAAGTQSQALATSMDLMPTLASLAGGRLADERTIDGHDLSALLNDPQADSPRNTLFYYLKQRLEAARMGDWKLHVYRDDQPQQCLYNLRQDIGETTDVADQHPDQVRAMLELIDHARTDLGDAVTQTQGQNVRPAGQVSNPKPLTEYDESHPYIESLYDLSESG